MAGRTRRRANFRVNSLSWSAEEYYNTPTGALALRPYASGTSGFGSPVYDEYEEISDVTGNINGVNPVNHHHYRLFRNAVTGYDSKLWHVPGLYIQNSEGGTNWVGLVALPSEPLIIAECKKALQEWDKLVPEATSIANFLYELREVKSLLPRIQGMKTLSNGFLSYEFGWKPLIGDLKKLATLVKDVRARLEALKRINHKWKKFRFSTDMTSKMTFGPTSDIPSSIAIGGSPWTKSFENHRCIFTATAMVKIDCPDLDSDIALLKGFIMALGLDNPAKIVWNVIPYSFVVDWFVKVSDRFVSPIRIYNHRITVRGFTSSIAAKGTINYYRDYPSALGQAASQKRFGGIAFERYERKAGFPVSYEALSVSGLTGKQQLLLSALISQRLLK